MSEPRPTRAIFRDDHARATLALDPGGLGVLAALRRGVQPQPGAFGFFDCPPPVVFVPEEVVDGVAVLAVSGPLEHHQHFLWTSYESLVAQVERALTHGDTRALILKIDSPGGVAAGMGEAHKALRRLSKATGIPIYAYADEMACSAAYHLASACTEVWTSESGVLGSVGVILCTVDETKALEKAGVAVRYVVTGARKADMHPGQPVTDDVIDVAQAKVDYLGGLFFAAVGKARKMAPAKVEALQAAVFHGPDAMKAGLADGVAGWDAFFRYVKDSVRAIGSATKTAGRATAPAARTSPGKAKAMATLLQAQQKLAKARAEHKAATEALDAAPGDKALRKAWALTLNAKSTAKASVDAKMSKVTKTSKHVTMEESDSEEEESVPSTEKSSAASSSAASSEMSSKESEEEEEEEERGSAAEEEERGESEEEEEKAKAWGLAHKAYKAATKGRDAYAIHGPKRLLAAVFKATGKRTVAEAMGVLAGLPVRRAADAKIVARVGKIEADGRKAKIDAIVAEAKTAGRAGATSKDGRASLRALGMAQGPKFLRAHVETLPVVAGSQERHGRADAEGNVIGAPDEHTQTAMMEKAMSGLSAKERAEFVKEYEIKAKATRTGGRI